MRTVIRYFFFFNDTATTEIYTLSLHDALPILSVRDHQHLVVLDRTARRIDERASTNRVGLRRQRPGERSEEHTSELQSQSNLVCRLLLEKKNSIRSTTLYI